MRHLSFSVLLSICIISIAGRAFSQGSNTFPWPANPPIGIGTQLSIGGPQSALQIHFNHSDGHSDTAILRLSIGDTTSSSLFGMLGLMPGPYDTAYTSLSRGNDLILHEHSQGDLILTNYQSTSLTHPYGAIRLATTPAAYMLPFPLPMQHDFERLTLLGSGNVGIDLPPDTSATGLGNPLDQFQLGGGSFALPGELDPSPGLTFYGGGEFEGQPEYAGGFFPADWRYIGYNYYVNHLSTSPNRSFRMARAASSAIKFSDFQQGTLEFDCAPYDSVFPSLDWKKTMTLNLSGQYGLRLWFIDTTLNPFHQLFDAYPPGVLQYGIHRNQNGLFYHNTPVFIGVVKPGDSVTDFTNLMNIGPDIGDDSTWMLAVDGPVLVKELFVLDSGWGDYVFDPGYKLTPLDEVEKYIRENHHLKDIPSASKIARTGVPVGRTENELTKKVEELTLYVIDQNKKIEQQNEKMEQLEADIQELKNQKEK